MSLGSFGVSVKHQWVVRVAQHLQIIIAFPAVGTHNSTFRHILLHELCEFLGSTVWNKAQSQSARVNYPLLLLALGGGPSRTHLNGSNDRCFVVITASFAFCPPTYKRFIHFNRMLIANSVALRSHQTGAELVEQLKRRFVARQTENHTANGVRLDFITVVAVSDTLAWQARHLKTTDARLANR